MPIRETNPNFRLVHERRGRDYKDKLSELVASFEGKENKIVEFLLENFFLDKKTRSSIKDLCKLHKGSNEPSTEVVEQEPTRLHLPSAPEPSDEEEVSNVEVVDKKPTKKRKTRKRRTTKKTK